MKRLGPTVARHLGVALIGTSLVVWGCDSPGGDGGSTGGGGAIAPTGGQSGDSGSLFSEMFGGGREDAACVGEDCPPNEPTEPACSQPLASAPALAGPCQSLCQLVGGCVGAPVAEISACTGECTSALAGVEPLAAQALFGCYQQASCQDIVGRDDDRADATDGDGSGSGAEPPPEEPPEAEHIDVMEQCFEGLMQTWGTTPAPAAKVNVCLQLAEKGEACGGTPSTGGSGGDAPTPAPDVDDDMQAACNLMGAMLTMEVFTRLSACLQLADCDAMAACLEDVLTCVPFAGFGLDGDDGGSAGVGGGTTEPVPDTPAPDDPQE